MESKKGFTLAEVLITLGIIGVVAAITIPILVNSYQKTQYVTALKKAYTEWNQALIQMAADNGCVGDLACTGLFDGDNGVTNQSLGTELVKYFKVVKNCESTSSGGPTVSGCMSDKTSWNFDGSGPRSSSEYVSDYRFITSDGMSFALGNWASNCAPNGSNIPVCGSFWVDVNGPTKSPNTWGRDLFGFFIIDKKGPALYPMGGLEDGDWGTPKCDINSPDGLAGSACAGRVIEEGWQMNY